MIRPKKYNARRIIEQELGYLYSLRDGKPVNGCTPKTSGLSPEWIAGAIRSRENMLRDPRSM